MTLSLALPADQAMVPPIRAALDALLAMVLPRGWRLDAAEADRVSLGLVEACTNVIEHGYRGQGGPLRLVLTATAAGVAADLSDDGLPYDWGPVAPPDLETYPERGFGRWIIQSAFDTVDLRRSADGNHLLLFKGWSPV